MNTIPDITGITQIIIKMNKVAVVGFGFMGIAHTLNILKNHDLLLAAIVDINPDLIEKNLKSGIGNISTGIIDPEELAGISKYSNLDECLRAEELDAVNICTHVNLHYEMTKTSLLKDKHVFLEKPFCLNVKQAEELISIAEKRKKILMIGHVVRFMPPYQQLKRWIDSQEFGKLKFLSLSRFCGLPSWGQWKEKNVKELSGGALFDLVIHDIDYANSILGMPSEIKCNYLRGEYTNHDYISAMWSYRNNDIHIKIEGGFTFHANFPFQASYMAQFEKASVVFTTLRGDIIQIADDKSIREISSGEGDGYFNEIAYFSKCIKNNSHPDECTPVSSLQAIQLCYNHIK
jgi:predicted dehydrogenase